MKEINENGTNEPTGVEVNTREFESKTVSKRLGLAAVRFSQDQPWALMLGKNLVSMDQFKSLTATKIHVWKNRRKYKEIRLMIIIDGMISERLKEKGSRKSNNNKNKN